MRRAMAVSAVALALGGLVMPAPRPARGEGPAPPRLHMIVVLDPGCAHTVAMVERLVEFRRVHPQIPIRLLAADLNAFARAPEETLAAFHRADLTLEWDPEALRTLGVTRTSTVAVVDHTGRGVRATGTPDLTALIQAAGTP